jgi:hypothetical protein
MCSFTNGYAGISIPGIAIVLPLNFGVAVVAYPFLSLQYYSSYEMAATTRHGSEDETENLG